MPDPATDFKDQITELRRTQILTGAAQVFAEKGFHKSTTREIAQAAGVSEGTIYNYFTTKRDLLVAMIGFLATDSLKRLLIDNPPADPGEFLTLILHDRFELAEERGRFIVPLLSEIFTDPELRAELYQKVVLPISLNLERYLQAHIEAGAMRPINPVIVTRAMIGAIIINFAFKLSLVDPRYEVLPKDELIEQIISLFLHGLLNEGQETGTGA
jgi:AcrR family transcriptional regulator